jgi:hypothetical protein
MTFLLNYPRVLFVVSLVLLWIASLVGAYFRRRCAFPQSVDEEHFSLILGATLALLGLLTGFTFAMAASRYDQRKDYEAQEANAIGTEYVRLDVLPGGDAAKLRDFLREYLNQRIAYYSTDDAEILLQIRANTSQLQSELWSTLTAPATAHPQSCLCPRPFWHE